MLKVIYLVFFTLVLQTQHMEGAFESQVESDNSGWRNTVRESERIIQSLHARVLLHPFPEFILGNDDAGADVQCGESLCRNQRVCSGTGDSQRRCHLRDRERQRKFLVGFKRYFFHYHPLTLIAIPTGQSYQIVINCGLNCAEAYSLFCDAIFEGVRLPQKASSVLAFGRAEDAFLLTIAYLSGHDPHYFLTRVGFGG